MTYNFEPYKKEIGDTLDEKTKDNGFIDAVKAILETLSLGSFNLQGTIDTATGSYPAGPSANDAWVFTVADTISGTDYYAGDAIVYDGSDWQLFNSFFSRTNPQIAQGDLMSLFNPKALGQAVHLTRATSSGPGIIVPHNSNLDMGTKGFTLFWRGSLDSLGDNYQTAITKFTTSGGHRGYGLYITNISPNLLKLRIGLSGDAGNADIFSTVEHNISIDQRVTIACSVVRETASATGSVDFYLDGVPLGETATIPASYLGSINTSAPVYISGQWGGSVRHAGTTSKACLFNRPLSSAEILDLTKHGIAYADQYGRQTPVYESDFSAGVDSWLDFSATLAGNIDGVTDGSTSKDNCLRATRDAGATPFQVYRDPALTASKNGRVAISVYVPSGQTYIDGFRVYIGSTSGTLVYNGSGENGSWVDIEVDLSASEIGSTTLVVYGYDGSSTSTDGAASGELMYIHGVATHQTGALLDIDMRTANASLQVPDSSTNNLHALLPPTGATPLLTEKEFTIRSTHTWSGTHEAQYIGGVNQNILPDNAWITDIIIKVSGATPHDIIIGDGSDGDRFVAITTGLAAGTQALTIANNTHDGTNKKMVIDPDTNSTMTIDVTVRGFIFED